MFESNHKKLFEVLLGERRDNKFTTNAEEGRIFWDDILEKNVQHNNNAEWLVQLEADLVNLNKQADVQVTVHRIEKNLRKIANWKSPGPHRLQGYWLKNLKSQTK